MIERFDFTNPPATWPTPASMLFDTIPIEQLTPEQAIDALLIAGRSLQTPAHLRAFLMDLMDLKHRQDRFNKIWTLVIAIVSIGFGMYLGAAYLA